MLLYSMVSVEIYRSEFWNLQTVLWSESNSTELYAPQFLMDLIHFAFTNMCSNSAYVLMTNVEVSMSIASYYLFISFYLFFILIR